MMKMMKNHNNPLKEIQWEEVQQEKQIIISNKILNKKLMMKKML
jgi:hypothetical protein